MSTNKQAQLISLTWQQKEVLHDGLNWWGKIYPMIFPVVSYSRAFEVNKQNYELPKHGFWNQLNWIPSFNLKNHTISFGTVTPINEHFPFAIAIYHQYHLVNDGLVITTTFANAGQEAAYFHFGHHPAFKIDATSHVLVKAQASQILPPLGRYEPSLVEVNEIPLSNLDFGKVYDTLVFKNHQVKQLSLVNQNYQVHFDVQDFANLQLWKPQAAMFLCVEPWQATNDDESEMTIREASQKRDIIKLMPRESKAFKFTITFS